MSNSNRIRRVSRIMRYLCTLIMALLPFIIIAIWFSPGDFLLKSIGERMALGEGDVTITMTTRILGCLVSMVPPAILIYGLGQLKQLFRLYSEGEIFGSENVNRFLKFARALFIYGIVSPVMSALLSIIVTINNPPGQRKFVIGIGNDDLTVFFIATVFLIIAWVMAEGHELSKENAQII